VDQPSTHSFLSSRLSPSYARPVPSFLPLPRPVLRFHRLVVPSVLPLGCPRFPQQAARRDGRWTAARVQAGGASPHWEMDGGAGAGLRSISSSSVSRAIPVAIQDGSAGNPGRPVRPYPAARPLLRRPLGRTPRSAATSDCLAATFFRVADTAILVEMESESDRN
jgi:hypothetical protein